MLRVALLTLVHVINPHCTTPCVQTWYLPVVLGLERWHHVSKQADLDSKRMLTLTGVVPAGWQAGLLETSWHQRSDDRHQEHQPPHLPHPHDRVAGDVQHCAPGSPCIPSRSHNYHAACPVGARAIATVIFSKAATVAAPNILPLAHVCWV